MSAIDLGSDSTIGSSQLKISIDFKIRIMKYSRLYIILCYKYDSLKEFQLGIGHQGNSSQQYHYEYGDN